MADIDELVISTAKGGTLRRSSARSTQHAGTVVPEDSEVQDFSELAGKSIGLASEEDSSPVEAQLKAAGWRRATSRRSPSARADR